MRNITFYILDNDTQQDNLNAVELLACELIAKFWENGKSILIVCESKQQAIKLDDALWIRPLERFIPHNLSGSELCNNAPIELTWYKEYNNSKRDLLINLRTGFTDFIATFTEIIDFVPSNNLLKQLARERYKAYRMAGFHLKMVSLK